MRVVWVVGGHDATIKILKEALSSERLQTEYLIRRAQKISEIPPTHLADPGVTILLDCFHPRYPGLDGLKALHQAKFQGAVFLFGEPAPESAIEAFKKYGLAGFFPAMDRMDPFFVAGLLHYRMHFTGAVNVDHFLSKTGKSSVEQIKNLKDFGAFQTKLGNFVGRFGIDLSHLRKVLMGLSLSHIKAGGGGTTVDQSFPIYYGMDPEKLCLAVPAFSKGVSKDVLVGELCQVLSQVHSPVSINPGLFPEIHHVAKSAENLVILSGNATLPASPRDPMLLLATIPFPSQAQLQKSQSYHFTLAIVEATEDMPMDKAEEIVVEASPVAASGPTEVLVEKAAPAPAAAPTRTLESVDIDKILSEPKITGDQPDVRSPAVSAAPSAGNHESYGAGSIDPATTEAQAAQAAAASQALGEAQAELERLKAEVQVMAHDIQRLMKERRQPTTDRELRDAFTQVEEKMKAHLGERQRLQKDVELRDKQIEILKQQIEDIKKNKAA